MENSTTKIAKLLSLPIKDGRIQFVQPTFTYEKGLDSNNYNDTLLKEFASEEGQHCRKSCYNANKYAVLFRKYALAYDIETSLIYKSTKSIYTYYPEIHGGISVVWYVFKSNNSFFFLANDGTKGEDMALYYPSTGKAYPLASGCPRTGRFFDKPIEQIRKFPQEVYSYINSKSESSVALLQATCNHWGHVMAQELPAYDNLPETNNYKALALGRSFIDYNKFNSRLGIRALSVTDEHINEVIFRNNLLVARPTTRTFQFTNYHALELINNAKDEVNSDLFNSLNSAKLTGHSIYAFDIRINQRVPLNQVDMFQTYINSCSKRFEQPIFVVTGWSSKGDKLDTQEDLSIIKAEFELFNSLKASNPGFKLFRCIGLPLSEKILVQSLCEYHVSSWGSGLSYFWEIVRIPGLVHGNKHCLSRKQRPLISRRDEVELPRQSFLSVEDVLDVDSRTGLQIKQYDQNLMRNNYVVDIKKFQKILECDLDGLS
jgi:hypothetical protein